MKTIKQLVTFVFFIAIVSGAIAWKNPSAFEQAKVKFHWLTSQLKKSDGAGADGTASYETEPIEIEPATATYQPSPESSLDGETTDLPRDEVFEALEKLAEFFN